ncbi:RNA polymerase sigma-70 factor [Chitinophaga barathri]|nr:RNA polymerase sigma-70 factor [Chitinophaga barathri]
MYDKQPDETLLQLIAAGDDVAFTIMYRRYEQHIREVALMYTKDPEASREIVQEVFRRIWEKREKLTEIKSLKDYLFIIARNLIFNQFKKAAQELAVRKQRLYETLETINDADFKVRNQECEFILNTAIASLPPQRKKIYQLAREKGLSYEEIATELRISRFTVKNQMVQALQSIRLYLLHHMHTLLPLLCISILG